MATTMGYLLDGRNLVCLAQKGASQDKRVQWWLDGELFRAGPAKHSVAIRMIWFGGAELRPNSPCLSPSCSSASISSHANGSPDAPVGASRKNRGRGDWLLRTPKKNVENLVIVVETRYDVHTDVAFHSITYILYNTFPPLEP